MSYFEIRQFGNRLRNLKTALFGKFGDNIRYLLVIRVSGAS